MAEVGEAVLDGDRNGGVHGPVDQTVALEGTEGLGEHLLADALDADYLDSTHTEATDLATLVRLVAGGRLHPEIGLLDDWSRAGESIDALLARTVRGNAVLTIGDPGGSPPALDARAVVERYIAALNAGDEPAIAASFAEDAVWRLDGELPISGTWNGRDEILGGFFATAGTFVDPASTRVEVTRSLADGDHVAVEWTSRARTRDGAPYENHCAGVFTVRDGKIRAVREYMDTHYAHKHALNAIDAPENAPASTAEEQPSAL